MVSLMLFVFEFENEMDRKYYSKEDPARGDFVKNASETSLPRLTVVDFVPGEY